jgi:hypothetical protein
LDAGKIRHDAHVTGGFLNVFRGHGWLFGSDFRVKIAALGLLQRVSEIIFLNY